MAKSSSRWKFGLIMGLIILVGYLAYRETKILMGNGITGPVGGALEEITKKKVEEGKVLRVTFKPGTTNEKILALSEELKNIPGVNGYSFNSGQPLVVYLNETADKTDVMKAVNKSPFVESVSASK